MKRSQVSADEDKTYGQTDKRWEQVMMFLQMACWLVNDVSVSRWFANGLPDEARLQCVAVAVITCIPWYRVSVTPFNPISLIWSDANNVTPFLFRLACLSSLDFLMVSHQQSVFFVAWWAGSLQQAASLKPFSNHSVFYLSSSLVCLSAQQGKLETLAQVAAQNLFFY